MDGRTDGKMSADGQRQKNIPPEIFRRGIISGTLLFMYQKCSLNNPSATVKIHEHIYLQMDRQKW